MADDSDPFADYKKWLDPVGTAQAAASPGFNIAKEEKLNDIARRESGWANIRNAQGGPDSGYFQFIPSSWHEAMGLAGLSAEEQAKYPEAINADYLTQRKVASAFFDRYGETPWKSSAPAGASLMPPPGQQTADSSIPAAPPIPTHSYDPTSVAPIPPSLQDKMAETTQPAAPAAVASHPTDVDPFTDYKKWLTPPPSDTIVQRGLTSAGIETEQLFNTLHALGDKLLGNEDGMRDLMSLNSSLDKKLKDLQPRYTNIDDVINRGSVGDYIDWLGYNLGEQIPNLGLIALGGGVTKYIATGLTRAVGEGILSKEVAQEAMAKIARRASLAGAYAVVAGQSTGQIAQEQYKATGTMNPYAAAGFGMAAAVPATFGPGAIMARMGLPENIASDLAENIRGQVMKVIPGLAGRVAGGVAGYGLESGAASTAQAMVMSLARKYVDQNYQLLGQDNVNRILAAAESGTLLGVVTGGVMPTPPHVYDEYISRQTNKAFGLDPNHKSNPVEFTKSDDPRFDKAFPTDTPNQSVNMIMQGFKDHAIGKGSYDDMHPDDQKAFESREHTLETLNPLANQVADAIKKEMTNKLVKADDGTEFIPTSARVDLKNEKVELTGQSGQTATASTRDLPLREMTIKAADKLHEQGRPLTVATPDGYTMGRLGETNLTDNWKHNIDKGILKEMYNRAGSEVQNLKGQSVDVANMKPGVAFAKSARETDYIPLKTRIAIQRMAKRFMPGAKIIVDTHAAGSPINSRPNGWALAAGDNHYIIYIGNLATHDMHYAIAHEFGHVAAWENFARLSPARRIAIFNEYSNSLKDPTHDGIKAMSANQMSFFSQRAIARGTYDRDYAKNMLSWYDVDEHFAEQFTKALLTKQTGFVDKYFENTASHINQINEAFNAANKDINLQLNPMGTMARWFDDMHNSAPHFSEEIMDTLVKSSTENAKALGVPINPAQTLIDRFASAPPLAPENETLRGVGAEVGVTPRQFAEADRFSRFTRWMWTTSQMAKLYPHIEPLRRLSQFFSQFHADRMGWANRANDVLVQQRELGKERSKMLDALETTLDKMPYLGANEAARWPHSREMGVIVRRIGMSREDWQAIKPVYEAKRDMYKSALDRVEETAMAAANRIVDPAARTAKINSISYEMSAMRNRPYYPHMRYGDYAVMVRDAQSGKKLHYEMFWTQRQAQQAAESLSRQYPGSRYELSRLPNEVRDWIGLPPALLDQLRTMPDITPAQQDWIDNFRFEMSPENSFSKRMMHRTGLPGYDMNGVRSFANYFSAASGHMARLKYGFDIDQAVKDLYKSASIEFRPDDLKGRSVRTQMADWASQEARYVMHPPNEHAAVRAFAFQWWLAFNPSTAFVHLMQMPMFTAPYMSKLYGAGGIAHMMRAYGDMRQLYSDPAHSTLEPEYIRAQTQVGHEGVLTENRGVDLAGWANHGTLNRAMQGTRLQHFLMTTGGYTASIMKQVEKNNRLVTFRAAWKAALENPANPHVQKLITENDMLYRQLLGQGERPEVAAAYIAARDAVQQTHFQYTQIARPRWQRGLMNPFTPFMMYKQQALWFFMHNPAGLRALGTVFALTGVAGLPFEQNISDIVKDISEFALGVRFDPNEYIRSIANELMGHPEVVMHGLGRDGLGMPQLFNALGMPISGFDVSRRLGYGDELPGVAEFSRDQQESAMERFGNMVASVVGGGLEVPINFAKTFQGMSVPLALHKTMEQSGWQTLRGLEPVMPAVIRNGVEAMRYAAQGGDIGPMGEMRTKLDMNDTTGWSAVFERALGFTPTDVARGGEFANARSQIEAYWKIRQADLSRMFVQARMTGDKQAIQDTIAMIKQFNQDSPLRGVRIQAKTLIADIKNEMRKRMEQERGISRTGATQLLRPDYPEYQPPGNTSLMPTPPPQ